MFSRDYIFQPPLNDTSLDLVGSVHDSPYYHSSASEESRYFLSGNPFVYDSYNEYDHPVEFSWPTQSFVKEYSEPRATLSDQDNIDSLSFLDPTANMDEQEGQNHHCSEYSGISDSQAFTNLSEEQNNDHATPRSNRDKLQSDDNKEFADEEGSASILNHSRPTSTEQTTHLSGDWPFPSRARDSISESLSLSSPARISSPQRSSVDIFFNSGDDKSVENSPKFGPEPESYTTTTSEDPPPYSEAATQPRVSTMSYPSNRSSRPFGSQASTSYGRSHEAPPSANDSLEQGWRQLQEARRQLNEEKAAFDRERYTHQEKYRAARAQLRQEKQNIDIERTRLEQMAHFATGSAAEGTTFRGRPARGMGSRLWNSDLEDDYLDEEIVGGNSGFDDPYRPHRMRQARGDGMRGSTRGHLFANARPDLFQNPHDERREKEEKRLVAFKKAFEEYESKWKQIEPTDPNLPYPSLNGSSEELLNKPNQRALQNITISEDTAAELNAMTFFLLAFELRADIVVQGLETPTMDVSPDFPIDNITALRNQLKVERTRWHPDKFGRRMLDASDAQKSALEKEARFVFNAVSSLYERCEKALQERSYV